MSTWNFSPEIRKEVDEFCLLISKNVNKSDSSQKWIKLSNSNVSKPETVQTQDFDELPEVTSNSNLSSLEEEEIANALLQAIQSNSQFDIGDVGDICSNSPTFIFTSLQKKLNDQEFSNFCKMICTWSNESVITECFNHLIFPKLQEKNESSVCTVLSLKILTEKFPEKICNNILIPLVTDNNKKFKDTELLTSIFPILSDLHKDNLIMAIMRKNNFEEDDWLMLHSLVNDLPSGSIPRILEVMTNCADEFSSNQTFSKFLVAICKNSFCSSYKDQLHQIIEKNKTLLKRQALRFFEML